MITIDFCFLWDLRGSVSSGICKCQGKCQDEKEVFVDISSRLNKLPELVLFLGPNLLWKWRVL